MHVPQQITCFIVNIGSKLIAIHQCYQIIITIICITICTHIPYIAHQQTNYIDLVHTNFPHQIYTLYMVTCAFVASIQYQDTNRYMKSRSHYNYSDQGLQWAIHKVDLVVIRHCNESACINVCSYNTKQ